MVKFSMSVKEVHDVHLKERQALEKAAKAEDRPAVRGAPRAYRMA
jgi:hypothetical protein